MIKYHQFPENCISGFGCGEDINDGLVIAKYVVLWNKGVAGGEGEV